MRGMRIAGVAMALGMCALNYAVCQDVDQPFTMQANVGSGFNCGRVSSPLYCYGVPVTINGVPSGTFWLDTYVTGSSAGTGFVYWYGIADLAEATVTGNTPTFGTATSNGRTISNAITSLAVTFRGGTNDGDTGTYTGTMNLTFTYYYSSGGGGRGGAGAGWRFICTGGSVQINYN
jgi:hypothetical protein